MPVVRADLRRLSKMVKADRRKILERIPYVGLDIESLDRGTIRVEYSPNRPDFGTDYGIARALRGVLRKEVGLPVFPTAPSGISVSVDARLRPVRPHIACVTVAGLRLDDEDIRQMISLQEDLHNGLGRKRRVVAVGLHDLDAVKPPVSYRAVDGSFMFVPLGGEKPLPIRSILSGTPEGRAYGPILSGSKVYPVITDSRGTVLSFPPIINGSATAVTTKTRRMFVDVTSTDSKAGDDVLAVVATTLAEAGGKLGTVLIQSQSRRTTPDLSPTTLPLDLALVKSVLGLDLSTREVASSLARSRLGLRGRTVLAPRYRVDLMHPVDVAEEVALGYGFDRIVPVYPPSERPGEFNAFEDFLDTASTVMAGAGMVELMNYELVDEASLYSRFRRPSDGKITVQDPKSLEHSVLRDSLIPVLMAALSGNVKSDYPQRVFEIGRVYNRRGDGVSESWHLGCLVAHSQSSFTEAKMFLESACRVILGAEASSAEGDHWAFALGRCAGASIGGHEIGHVGEVKPEAVEAFGLGVPVSGFEIDLSSAYERLK